MLKKCFNLLLFNILLSLQLAGQIHQIRIEPAVTHQTIDNFAASDAWSGNYAGKYWGIKERSQIAEWLFSTSYDESGQPKGIGLSLWRVNVGAGTFEQADADIQPLQRRAESFLTTDGNYFDWGKAAGQQYFMEQAAKLGCNNFLLFSNSPPVQYTINGKGWSPSDHAANIKPGYFDKFANYLAEVALYYTRKGFKIEFISPINEPQVKWDTPKQEGSPWRKEEIKKTFEALNKALIKHPELSEVKMLFGETANLKVIYEKDETLRKRFGGEEAPDEQLKAFFEPASPYYMANLTHLRRLIGGHSYNNHTSNLDLRNVRSNVGKATKSLQVDFHQTEWCLLPNFVPPMDGFTTDWKPGNRTDMQVGLLMGRLIYSDFVDGNAKAWGYWKAMELNGDHALISLKAKDNNIFYGGTVSSNKILWALGNYSFFIRPGYVRIGTHGADDLNSLAGSSYMSPDRSRIVTVLVNSSFESKVTEFHLPPRYKRTVKNISHYETNESSDLHKIPVAGSNKFKYTIPPRTISTVVFDLI